MYDLKPPYVMVLDEVMEDAQMRARAERMLAAFPTDTPVETISLAELPEAARDRDWASSRRRMGMADPPGDPGFFFGVMRWDGKYAERMEELKTAWPEAGGPLRAALGYDAFMWCDVGMRKGEMLPDDVCRPAWRIHLINGCPHKCFYCGFGNLMTVMMNVEEYIGHLDELAKANPWEKTFLYEDDSEALCIEPEYGAVPELAEYFATTEDRYLLIHTKSANVDFFEGVSRAGCERTIIVWSLTARTQSEVMEAGSGTMEQRIEAARKCDELGICTRYKYKPIVPVKGWREEIAEMTQLVFERSNPDLIALFTLCWMDYEELIKLCDTDLLDPVYLDAAREAAEEMKGTMVRPFPDWVRKEIYEFCIQEIRSYSKDIPIVLCTESTAMWRELGPTLGYTPHDYPCGCGPQATPWLKRLAESPWKVSKPVGVEGYAAPY
jgi:spore photoproduct lyase